MTTIKNTASNACLIRARSNEKITDIINEHYYDLLPKIFQPIRELKTRKKFAVKCVTNLPRDNDMVPYD